MSCRRKAFTNTHLLTLFYTLQWNCRASEISSLALLCLTLFCTTHLSCQAGRIILPLNPILWNLQGDCRTRRNLLPSPLVFKSPRINPALCWAVRVSLAWSWPASLILFVLCIYGVRKVKIFIPHPLRCKPFLCCALRVLSRYVQ